VDWETALSIVLARGGHGHDRYRELCADDHSDREIWRSRVIAMATGQEQSAPGSPPTSPVSPSRPIDAILAEAKAEMGITPISVAPRRGCCG
jgi:hypothetical protein